MKYALRLVLLCLTVLLLPAPAGCGDNESSDVATATRAVKAGSTVTAPTATDSSMVIHVKMEGIKFEPDEIVIMPGTTVVWTNNDPVSHNVTAAGGSFASEDFGEGGTFSFTFEKPGTYEYTCTLHPPNMKGKVIVEG